MNIIRVEVALVVVALVVSTAFAFSMLDCNKLQYIIYSMNVTTSHE